MNPYITRALATARALDLQRAAGGCSALIEHRHTALGTAVRWTGHRLHRRHAARPAPVCCA